MSLSLVRTPDISLSALQTVFVGYSNVLEGLSGGFVYGAGGSGLITSRLGSPVVSGSNTPTAVNRGSEFTQNKLNAAFNSNTDERLKVS